MPKNADHDVAQALRDHNRGRDPERLAMKYAKMRESAFIFLRGACHLFYDHLPDVPALRTAPLAWCCGDLHFENFGSYKSDNRLVYFDINDFDEAALAPCTWDILRLLTSFRCGAQAMNASPAEAIAVGSDCLNAYREELVRGKPLWVEAETSTGLVHDLFSILHARSRPQFLDRRTSCKGSQRRLKIDGEKALSIDDETKARLASFIDRFAATQPNPGFYKLIDAARRIAGTGSLGVMRYVLLIEGKGSPNANYLLDVKEAKPSALVPKLTRLGIHQPAWHDEAVRVTTVQKRLQAVDHAFLFPAVFDGIPSILKALQPSEDRVAIASWGKKIENLRDVVATMGRLLAWDQLRASGHAGAANADALIDFAQGSEWMKEILDATDTMVDLTNRQWADFCSSKAIFSA